MKRDTQRLIDRLEINTTCSFYKVLKYNEETEDFYEIPVCSAPSKMRAFSPTMKASICKGCRSKR